MNPMSLGFRDLWIRVGGEGANLASPGENKDRCISGQRSEGPNGNAGLK